MKWYRINIDYLSKEYDNKALEISNPCGDNKEKAIKEYKKEIAKKSKCVDNNKILARVDLTEYIYNNTTKETTTNILMKNYI